MNIIIHIITHDIKNPGAPVTVKTKKNITLKPFNRVCCCLVTHLSKLLYLPFLICLDKAIIMNIEVNRRKRQREIDGGELIKLTMHCLTIKYPFRNYNCHFRPHNSTIIFLIFTKRSIWPRTIPFFCFIYNFIKIKYK